jgi:hypothetical protein
MSVSKYTEAQMIAAWKQLEASKAAIGQMQQDYAFSQRRACALMMLGRYRVIAVRASARMSHCARS